MECKFYHLDTRSLSVLELIDTLWNVNIINTIKTASAMSELIDTLWNVNNRLGYIVIISCF